MVPLRYFRGGKQGAPFHDSSGLLDRVSQALQNSVQLFRAGVSGMSICSTPSSCSASSTALTTVGRRGDRSGLADTLDAERIGLGRHFDKLGDEFGEDHRRAACRNRESCR